MQGAIEHAKAIKQRLFNPPNAVRDRGIDLSTRKSFGVKGFDERLVFVPAPVAKPNPTVQVERPKIDFVPESKRPLEPLEPTLKDILLAVCEVYDARPLDVKSQRRTADVLAPRQVVMMLARYLTKASTPAIGRFLGGRDHSTVFHALQKMKPLEIELDATMPPDAPLYAIALKAADLEAEMRSSLSARGRHLRNRQIAA